MVFYAFLWMLLGAVELMIIIVQLAGMQSVAGTRWVVRLHAAQRSLQIRNTPLFFSLACTAVNKVFSIALGGGGAARARAAHRSGLPLASSCVLSGSNERCHRRRFGAMAVAIKTEDCSPSVTDRSTAERRAAIEDQRPCLLPEQWGLPRQWN